MGTKRFANDSELWRFGCRNVRRSWSKGAGEHAATLKNGLELPNCIARASDRLSKGSTTSFARMLNKQGNRDEACTMLAEIYNW